MNSSVWIVCQLESFECAGKMLHDTGAIEVLQRSMRIHSQQNVRDICVDQTCAQNASVKPMRL